MQLAWLAAKSESGTHKNERCILSVIIINAFVMKTTVIIDPGSEAFLSCMSLYSLQ
jgi:hypothetical protein